MLEYPRPAEILGSYKGHIIRCIVNTYVFMYSKFRKDIHRKSFVPNFYFSLSGIMC